MNFQLIRFCLGLSTCVEVRLSTPNYLIPFSLKGIAFYAPASGTRQTDAGEIVFVVCIPMQNKVCSRQVLGLILDYWKEGALLRVKLLTLLRWPRCRQASIVGSQNPEANSLNRYR